MTNVLKDTCIVYLKRGSRIDTYTVMPGYYRNTEGLLEFLNKGVADRGIALTMAEGKVFVAIASDFIVSFSPSLARKLGFFPLSAYGVGEHIASHRTDLTVKNVETLFVYCNVLEHVVVGDVMAPLLRIVDMKRTAEHNRMHKIILITVRTTAEEKLSYYRNKHHDRHWKSSSLRTR